MDSLLKSVPEHMKNAQARRLCSRRAALRPFPNYGEAKAAAQRFRARFGQNPPFELNCCKRAAKESRGARRQATPRATRVRDGGQTSSNT